MGAPLSKSEIVISRLGNRDAIKRALQKKGLRRLAPRLYTTSLEADPAAIVKRNVWPIAAELLPGALIVDRTALENRPASDGSVFLLADRSYDLVLPGITFRPRSGLGPIEGVDKPFMGGLWMSSQGRALLENMRPTRARNHVRPTLSRAELEEWMERLLRRGGGAEKLNALRDEVKDIAKPLRMEEEAQELSQLISTLLGTHDTPLVTKGARARSMGLGYDSDRLDLFETLRIAVGQTSFPRIPVRKNAEYLPFFESYFSNFIEGTEFEIGEAYNIVFEGAIPEERPEDAHDILATFQVVSDQSEMARVAKSPEEFLKLLKYRHSIIMDGRKDVRPGEFKIKSNRSGETIFVEPDLVEGTLIRGFEILKSLEDPMARAVFVMFLIAEVHPFADGNGRMARIMMNSELVHAGEERIIIPTVFRSEYLQSLKALTHNDRASALIDVLSFAQRYVSEIEFSDYDTALRLLTESKAFGKPADSMGAGDRLILPSRQGRLHRYPG